MTVFGLRPKRAEVLSHWYSLVPNFNSTSKDFYEAVEKELKERQVPGLDITRVEFAEGGLLSGKREYLRMTRERLVFDICAAPFGTSYFFSCRFAEIPCLVQVWELLLLPGGLFVIGLIGLIIVWQFLGLLSLVVYPFLVLAVLVFAIYVMRNAVALGLKDLDATLLKTPVLGSIYQSWFRKETYYREDTRLMYLDTVNEVVKAKVEEITGAKGIKLVRFNEHSPILSELYKPTEISLPRPNQPA